MNVERVLEHLYLVLMSVSVATILGLILGILAYLNLRLRKVILILTELLQTIPSLALLGLVMILFGPGKTTVIIGIVLYSLLPIVHNTYLGLAHLDKGIKEAARGMGLSAFDRLFSIELPLVFPLIFAGIRIAAVTAVGIAVFASTIGGGGLGSIINRGIRIQNMQLVFSGTISLMIIAIVLDNGMGMIEKRLTNKYRLTKKD